MVQLDKNYPPHKSENFTNFYEILDSISGLLTHSAYLHAHDGEDKNDYGEYETEVAKGTHRPTYDADEQVESRPRLG